MSQRTAPLPLLDGVAPSYMNLPGGRWPSMLAFLVGHCAHVAPELWHDRLRRGAIYDHAGNPLSLDSPYPGHGRIWYYREVPPEIPVPFDSPVLYQDEYLVVADKPHFLSCIPAGRHLRETLLTRLRHELNLPHLSPIHRLDRETAGVMVFCADPSKRGAYQQLFASRVVSKEYEAIAPYRNDLALPHVHRSRLEERPDCFAMHEVEGEINSETRIELLERRGDKAHYRLLPHTGKKHQLRAHLAALGIPILNDIWYPELLPDKGSDFSRPLLLLARAIEFVDPLNGQFRRFESRRSLDWSAA
ncbi:tRNA pseudouridine32 synthase / 23S rRNA pseudouridine746 synthase [Formivibrio citricus]|uniref:tRNA pseudouridine32 synthase / 23S rRNA pseudouridine746 synthase n=1 Tax=Formivibrio citricus TaxID=83765 RepID=A0A1I4VSV6_9NEIS|nr:pseudouridine synthase [Formivibrio citricus]SFN04215.1 tRNA pseudouridine32 synthase / 23S rRNA pseudouridine746 synthase [Formivibrio citricus]